MLDRYSSFVWPLAEVDMSFHCYTQTFELEGALNLHSIGHARMRTRIRIPIPPQTPSPSKESALMIKVTLKFPQESTIGDLADTNPMLINNHESNSPSLQPLAPSTWDEIQLRCLFPPYIDKIWAGVKTNNRMLTTWIADCSWLYF
jgi:hypothetical protein